MKLCDSCFSTSHVKTVYDTFGVPLKNVCINCLPIEIEIEAELANLTYRKDL